MEEERPEESQAMSYSKGGGGTLQNNCYLSTELNAIHEAACTRPSVVINPNCLINFHQTNFLAKEEREKKGSSSHRTLPDSSRTFFP
jgi:hypothetical protein